MKTRHIIVIGVGVILLPILINIITGFNSPNNISVVGNAETWVQFFGSYIGGVLTAIIGFWAMERGNYQSNHNIAISIKRQEIAVLEQTLANCVSLFDYSRVGTIALYLDDNSKYDDVLYQLDEYFNKVSTTANAWGVIYANSSKQEIRNFQDIYLDCFTELTRAINEVTDKVKLLKKTRKDDPQWVTITNEITGIIQRGDQYKILLSHLLTAAQQWIASEKNELEKLKHS